jgi:O-antigen/teichoic acid export membrane protein
VLTYAVSKIISVATTVVLARLLAPEDFGVFVIALLALGFLALFRDLGIGAAVVLRRDLTDRALGTAFTLVLISGVLSAAIVAGLAPLAASVFREPMLTSVLLALSPTAAIGSFGSFYEWLLQRDLEFGRRFWAQLTQTLAFSAAALLLAVLGVGVWSLVGGQVIAMTAFSVSLLALSRHRIRPSFEKRVASELIATGQGFFTQGWIAFLQESVDYLAVGRILGSTQLGYYSMAYRLGELPYRAIADPVAKVTFPGFARMRHRGESIGRSFLATFRMVALVTCPIGVILSATAEPFTRVVFGEKWLPMVGTLTILGLWAAVRTLEGTVGWLLNSVGQAGILGRLGALMLLPLVPGVVFAAKFGGTEAVAWVMLGSVILLLLAVSFVAERRAQIAVRDQWRAVRPIAVACPFAWLAAWSLARATEVHAPAVALTAAVLGGLAAYAVGVSLLAPGILRDAAAQLSRLRRRPPSAAPQLP